jgi:hypothetical protein
MEEPQSHPIVRWAYLSVGWTSLALAIIGVALPLVPTTPFLLLAAFAFARGSRDLHVWLINHPRFGPPIEQWRLHRAISRRAKWAGTLSMVAVVVISRLLEFDPRLILAQIAVLAGVSVLLWTRRDPPPESHA